MGRVRYSILVAFKQKTETNHKCKWRAEPRKNYASHPSPLPLIIVVEWKMGVSLIFFFLSLHKGARFPLNHDSGQVILFHQPSAQLIHLTTPPLLGTMLHLSEVRLSYVFMGKTKNKKSFLEISRFPDFPYSHLGAPYGRFVSSFKLHRRIISSRWLSWPGPRAAGGSG